MKAFESLFRLEDIVWLQLIVLYNKGCKLKSAINIEKHGNNGMSRILHKMEELLIPFYTLSKNVMLSFKCL